MTSMTSSLVLSDVNGVGWGPEISTTSVRVWGGCLNRYPAAAQAENVGKRGEAKREGTMDLQHLQQERASFGQKLPTSARACDLVEWGS